MQTDTEYGLDGSPNVPLSIIPRVVTRGSTWVKLKERESEKHGPPGEEKEREGAGWGLFSQRKLEKKSTPRGNNRPAKPGGDRGRGTAPGDVLCPI